MIWICRKGGILQIEQKIYDRGCVLVGRLRLFLIKRQNIGNFAFGRKIMKTGEKNLWRRMTDDPQLEEWPFVIM